MHGQPGSANTGIVINYFGDEIEGDFDYFTIGPLNFDAGGGQGLGGLHAAHHAAHAMPVGGYNFDIAHAVERLQGRQGLGHFHLGSVTKECDDYTWSKCIRKLAPQNGCSALI
jgi:hypothetical protein